MPVFATPEPIEVAFDLGAGNVRIIATDRTDTVVEVRPSDAGKSADIRGAEQAAIEFMGGRLRVTTGKGLRYLGFGPTESVEVTIGLPAGSSIEGRTAYGRIVVEGRVGRLAVKTGGGDIQVDEAGPIDVHTGAGGVDVNRAIGRASIDTGTGTVRIRDLVGSASIKNSNGNTIIGEAVGPVAVRAAYGYITIDRAHDDLELKTAYGNVRVDELIRGSARLESSYGELEVGVPDGTAVWLDVTSVHGNVRSSLTTLAGPDGTGETAEIRARTSYGDVVIRRVNEKNSQIGSTP
jgi:DUF4097 and DUF4098 domain-containing protein YvlB